MPLATAVVEPDAGRFVHANRSFKETWFTPGARTLASLIEQENPAKIAKLLSPAPLAPDKSRSEVLRISLPEGGVAWVRMFARPFQLDIAENATLLMVQLVDLTSDKRMLDDLVARETRWNSALVSSASGVWDHDYRAGRKYYSPTWRLIRGMSLEDPLPPSKEAWLELVHPEDRAHTLYAMERQEAGDPDYLVFAYREKHKDGHYVWIECRGACVDRDESGRAMRVVGTDTDITSRKETEQRAARATRRLEMALAISGVGVFEADLTSGDVDWDERMYEIYGVDPAIRINVGQTWESFLHPDDAARVLARVETHRASHDCFSDQYRVRLSDGTERVIRSFSMMFIDVDGHTKLVGANWDVTQDVQMREELERAKMLAEARATELEETRSQIEHNSLHDYLTGLPNRRFLDRRLKQESESCASQERALGVLHIDLDAFKQINDSFGHSAGDAVLCHAAMVLREAAEATRFAARLGGDEFVLIAPFTGSKAQLADIAESVLHGLHKPFVHEGNQLCLGASIGIAWAAGSRIDCNQVLQNADIALYRAKGSGKNRYAFF
ncbi:diguanylate cyclase domain-containing protein [Rhizobium helianthi]|uniref:Diguanylate cyclase domain-containing protein n=1 Tax=Rhizobium helianthi TaxID=1132695 RepID=A0ABW4M105_9HYPH